MSEPDHDSAAFLRVRYLRAAHYGGGMMPGWCVVRVCPCHFNEPITVPFPTEKRAERALRVLDDDARQRAASRAAITTPTP